MTSIFNDKISAERLREALSFDPETGEFRRRRPNGTISGKRAGSGSHHKRYRYLRVDGINYSEHRLAWLFIYGKWPDGEIDHINMDRADNRIVNLREATPSQNQANRKVRKRNKLGIKGVMLHKRDRKYVAQIKRGNKVKHLGYFQTAEEAAEAYRKAALEIHGEFARF